VPLCLAARRRQRHRPVVAAPAKNDVAIGTSPEFAELPDTVRLPADVSRSSTVKLRAGVAVSDTVLVGGMLEITGAVFTGRTLTDETGAVRPPARIKHIYRD